MKRTKLTNWLLAAAFFLMIIFAACKPIISKDSKLLEFQSTQNLKKFSSAQEVLDFLKNADNGRSNIQVFAGGRGIRAGDLAQSAAFEASAPQEKSSAKSSESPNFAASDYSRTNVQVEGVDEADFVKNDGKYIYEISQNNLVIVDAFPAENAKLISETKLKGMPRNMFVNKDRLIVFSDDNAEVPVFAQYDFIPRPRYTSKTHVFVYDISDRSAPKLSKDYSLNGNYFESRRIGDYVYFIVKDDVYSYNKAIDLPAIKEASKTIIKPEIFYFDNPEYYYTFHTIASFNMFQDDEKVNAKTFMLGQSNNLYVSQNNIYITYQKNLPYAYYEVHNQERFFDVVLPLLPADAQIKINAIKSDSSFNSYKKWDKISVILEETYNSMDKDGKNKLIAKIEDAIEEYEAKLEQERRKTVIHKIKINDGQIEYGARGEVPGYLLNQFSMDESKDYFRVATTTEFYGIRESGYVIYNNVYVLDGNLNIAGKIEAIAPDEKIYSTRFIGDRLYMVTFKRVDPLFVIDLSAPQKPEILGELKIPGFSDYIHPYDENHIIGIGKETGSNEWGGVSIKGLKLALFEVSDVKNPKLLYNYEIGEAGTDSEALREHKAFLFDRKKDILVIPVAEVKGKQYYDSSLGYYRQRFWQGAYVFGLTPENGFKLKGKITHNEGDEQSNYYYYGSPNAVRRSLYIGDALYTVSEGKLKANDLNNIDKEIKEIKLPYEKPQYYPYTYATAGSGVAVSESTQPITVK